MADVANTWPLEPTPSTMIEAITTIKSVIRERRDRKQTEKTSTYQVNNLIHVGSVHLK